MEDAFKHGPFGELIHSYTRAEAIADGVLIDVSQAAAEVGIRYPVAVTAAVWSTLVPDEAARALGQDERGRLHDLVWMLRCSIRAACAASEVSFAVPLAQPSGRGGLARRFLHVRAVCGPGDRAEPVITVMLTHED